MGNYLWRRYEELFKSSGADFSVDLEGLISPVLNDSDNAEIARVLSENDVKDMVWRMDVLRHRVCMVFQVFFLPKSLGDR